MQNEINDLKIKKRNNNNRYIDVDRSLTQENFMNYDFDFNEVTNPSFERKSFYYWQWQYMQENNKKSLVSTSVESLKIKK